MEVLKENLAKEVLKKLKEISELWDISSKKWKKLPDNEKQLFYKKEYQIRTDISNMILGAFPGIDFFSVGKNGSLDSEKLDLTVNINSENIEIERGVFQAQEYKYHIIKFKEKHFEENLLNFFEKDLNWYRRNDGICG